MVTAHEFPQTTFDLSGRLFRASREYELVPFDRLSSQEQAVLQPLGGHSGLYGILRPKPGGHFGVKQVGPETALLFLTLDTPRPIPFYVRSSLGEGWERTIIRLVLDGVLEVEVNDGFASGASAYGALCGDAPNPPVSGDIQRLTRDALLYAQELVTRVPATEAAVLAAKLYAYNMLPLGPKWRRRLPEQVSVRRFLGIDGGSQAAGTLRTAWKEAEPGLSGWILWNARGLQGGRRGVSRCWKLYVSPQPAALPHVFAATVERLHDLGAMSFKVGDSAGGVLRPDKMVLYFLERRQVLKAGADLSRLLRGVPFQGVPFTATVSGDSGLLSWGVDHLPDTDQPSWIPKTSWRVRVTRRLATSLVAGVRQSPLSEDPWRFALGRAQLDGIDPTTWAPLDPDEDAFSLETT